MATEADKQNNVKKGVKARAADDLDLLKVILDSDPALKRKVMRFMQKNYSKVAALSSKQ